jgi:hypothetical protein
VPQISRRQHDETQVKTMSAKSAVGFPLALQSPGPRVMLREGKGRIIATRGTCLSLT